MSGVQGGGGSHLYMHVSRSRVSRTKKQSVRCHCMFSAHANARRRRTRAFIRISKDVFRPETIQPASRPTPSMRAALRPLTAWLPTSYPRTGQGGLEKPVTVQTPTGGEALKVFTARRLRAIPSFPHIRLLNLETP
mgnify:CR=1 FL=1